MKIYYLVSSKVPIGTLQRTCRITGVIKRKSVAEAALRNFKKITLPEFHSYLSIGWDWREAPCDKLLEYVSLQKLDEDHKILTNLTRSEMKGGK